MTDKAVSALTSLTGATTATGDLLYIVDISEAAAADRSKKITAQELQNYLKTFPATIGVGGATPAASGAGISFPATLSASSDANTLDDYEEGDCSSLIAIVGGSTSGTGTYSSKSFRYLKVGALVTVYGYIGWTAHTGTGDLQLSGLPFTSNSQTSNYSSGTIGYLNNIGLTASNVVTVFMNENASFLRFWQYPVGGGASTAVPMDSAGEIMLSITYST
jgi:hypothetical protein